MEPENTLNEIKQYLETWLERNKKNQEVAPFVRDELERTEWEIQVVKALENHPSAGTALPADINTQVEQSYNIWKNELPMLPEYRPAVLNSLSSQGTAVASGVYAFISQPGVPIETRNYFSPNRYTYQQLQQTQNRPQEVFQRIKILKYPPLEDRFEKAQKAYYAHKNGTMENSASASEIRNLLYSLNGYLFAKARKKSEQKLTWEEYATRLSFYGRVGHEYNQIIKQGEIYQELIKMLSDAAKDRYSIDIDDVWTRIIDHIYIVLGSIKF